jgi:hypothetical protein
MVGVSPKQLMHSMLTAKRFGLFVSDNDFTARKYIEPNGSLARGIAT